MSTNYLNDIRELLARAESYDDKPHQLFTCLWYFAQVYEPDPKRRLKIQKLMDRAAGIKDK